MSKVSLSVCVIVRDEAPYLAEWIHFCRIVGFERFYIYLDYPRDTTESTLRYLDRSDIVLIRWTEDQYEDFRAPVRCTFAVTPQITAFNHWIKTYAKETEWVGFIDPDEFVYHASENDLRNALACVPKETSAVWIQWLVFGRNGHQKKPEGLTLMNYTRRGQVGYPKPYGHHGKIIARSDRLAYFGPHGSHNAIFHSGTAINEYGSPVTSGGHPAPSLLKRIQQRIARRLSWGKEELNADPTADQWRCNHYYNRSEEEALQKLARGDRNAVGKFVPDLRRLEVHNVNDIEDRDIWRFLPDLQLAMGLENLAPKITKGCLPMKTGLVYTQFLTFEIGRVCNLAQAHKGACPSADVNRYGRLNTSRQLHDGSIVDCAVAAYDMGFKGQIAFHYYNEPMLSWDRIKALVPRIKEKVPDAQFCLWTNGTILPDRISDLSIFSSIWVSNYAGRDWKTILAPTGAEIHIQDGKLDGRKESLSRANDRRCLRPYNELVIDAYGNGHLCCADWRGEIHLGNVITEGFSAVADQYLLLRNQVAKDPLPKDAPAFCRLCPLRMDDIFPIVAEVAAAAKLHLAQR